MLPLKIFMLFGISSFRQKLLFRTGFSFSSTLLAGRDRSRRRNRSSRRQSPEEFLQLVS